MHSAGSDPGEGSPTDERLAARRRSFHRDLDEYAEDLFAVAQREVITACRENGEPVPSGHALKMCVQAVFAQTIAAMARRVDRADDDDQIAFLLGYFLTACRNEARRTIRAQAPRIDPTPVTGLELTDLAEEWSQKWSDERSEEAESTVRRLQIVAHLTEAEADVLLRLLADGESEEPPMDPAIPGRRRAALQRARDKLERAAGCSKDDIALLHAYRTSIATLQRRRDDAWLVESRWTRAARHRDLPSNQVRLRQAQTRRLDAERDLDEAWQHLAQARGVSVPAVRDQHRRARSRVAELISGE